ncbi:MAG: hypothetical protein WBW16_11035 [Bacteroidota bacterium]
MKEKLKSIGSALLGIGIFIGIILLAAFFIRGGLWLSEILYPWLTLISAIAFFVCILILLPLAFFRKTRGVSGVGLFIASYIFGASLWVWTFLLTYTLWGATALFIGLFLAGVGVVPIAMLATLFNGEWSILAQLVLLVIFTFGSRMLGLYLSGKAEEPSYEVV